MRGHVRKRCALCGRTMRERRCAGCGGERSSWAFAVDAGRDENGKRRQKSQSGFKTKRTAEAALRQVIRDIEGGADPFAPDAVFGDFAAQWLVDRRSDDHLRPTTAHRYEDLLRSDILPVLGGLELRKVRPGHVRTVLARMAERGLSPSTRNQARAVMSGVFKRALLDGLVEVNPVSAVPHPKIERPDKTVPSSEQVGAFVHSLAGDPLEVPMVLAATLGTRRSESLAIAWSDLDLDSGSVQIRRGLQWMPMILDDGRVGRELRFTLLKTRSAHRTLQLLPSVITLLRSHRADQIERRLALGPGWHTPTEEHGAPVDLVSERGDGHPIDPHLLTKSFKRLAARAGLDPRTTLHDLRHAFVTALARKNIHPRLASELAGHSDPGFTMRTYAHHWEGGAAEGAAAIADAFGLDG